MTTRARWHPAAILGAGVLAVASALALPATGVAALLAGEVGLLARAGYRWRRLPRLLWTWSWLIALVLAIHTFTTTDAAPLGRPSLIGLGRGALALARITAMGLAVALLRRRLTLDDLIAGLTVWLRPLRPLGVDAAHFGLVVAVALGTAPRVIDESRRVEAVLRLRRFGAVTGLRPRRRWARLRDRVGAIAPAMESLLRRAETLPLALSGRVPAAPARPRPLPWPQGLMLLAWAALLTAVAW